MRYLLSVFVFLVLAAPPTKATLITVAAATSSPVDSGSSGATAIQTVNGVGLGAQYPAFPTTHTGANVHGWLSDGVSGVGDTEWVHYDFGSTKTLGAMRFWNYNGTSNFNRGLRNLKIYSSNTAAAYGDDLHASWVLNDSLLDMNRGATANFYSGVQGTTSTPYGEEYDLSDVAGQYIRFEVVSTWGEQAAFAEVQFIQAVPEPSSMILVGCAFGATLLRRRKRHCVC